MLAKMNAQCRDQFQDQGFQMGGGEKFRMVRNTWTGSCLQHSFLAAGPSGERRHGTGLDMIGNYCLCQFFRIFTLIVRQGLLNRRKFSNKISQIIIALLMVKLDG